MDDSPITDKKPSKAKIIWIILLVLLLIAANTAWGLFYFNQQTKLNQNIRSLGVEKQVLKEELADAKKSAKPSDDSSQWREIPELGVKYKVTDDTKDLTYTFNSSTKDHVSFSTIALTKKSNKTDNDTDSCWSASGAGGAITKYSAGEEADTNGDPVEKVSGAKKIGNYYFVLSHAQFACGTDTATNDLATQANNDTKTAFASLKAID